MTGVNQTINMALGIIVIAALVGAGGLGQEAMRDAAAALARPRPGRRPRHRRGRGDARPRQPLVHRAAEARPAGSARRSSITWTAIAAVAVVVDRDRPPAASGQSSRPTGASRGPTGSTMPSAWVRDNWRAQTQWLNDFIVRDVHVRISGWLKQSVAWPVIIVGSGLAGYAVRGWRLALFCGAAVMMHRPRRAVGPGTRDARAGVHGRRRGNGHRRPGRGAAPAGGRASSRRSAGARRLPDDPAAHLRDPVRHDLRRRHRARGHHRLGHLRHPAGDQGDRPRRPVGAGERSRRRRRSARRDGSCCGGCGSRSPCRRSCSPSTR